jgi:hypothetical protein
MLIRPDVEVNQKNIKIPTILNTQNLLCLNVYCFYIENIMRES